MATWPGLLASCYSLQYAGFYCSNYQFILITKSTPLVLDNFSFLLPGGNTQGISSRVSVSICEFAGHVTEETTQKYALSF